MISLHMIIRCVHHSHGKLWGTGSTVPGYLKDLVPSQGSSFSKRIQASIN